MSENICLELISSIVDTQKDLVVLFKADEIILSNKAFNSFFGISSLSEFDISAGFESYFVLHPSYFNKEKIQNGKDWFESILELPDEERIVSMVDVKYEPHAFFVKISSDISGYKMVSFEDITQDLIKRIMVQNSANIDKKTGAYTKKYFMQIVKSFEDAAVFNKKILALSLIELESHADIEEFVKLFNVNIRQDDMLVYWGDRTFLFVYFMEKQEHANLLKNKLQNVDALKEFKDSRVKTVYQKDLKEDVKSLLARFC